MKQEPHTPDSSVCRKAHLSKSCSGSYLFIWLSGIVEDHVDGLSETLSAALLGGTAHQFPRAIRNHFRATFGNLEPFWNLTRGVRDPAREYREPLGTPIGALSEPC